MSSEEIFTINSASRLTGFTIPTIRKRLPDLLRSGAIQTGNSWSIPLSALYASGLMVKVDSNDDEQVPSKNLQSVTSNEISILRAQLAEAMQRAAVAEAIATEREKALARADRALLAIEARQPVQATSTNRPWRWWRR